MTPTSFHLVLVAMLIGTFSAPASAQQEASEKRRVFIHAMACADVHPDERRAYATRPGIDTMLISLMQDRESLGRARIEAARVLAYVQTAMADSFIIESVMRDELDAVVVTVLMEEIAPRPDGFGIRLIEAALASGPRRPKLAAISATRSLPPNEERRLLSAALNDPDPVVAQAARLQLEEQSPRRYPRGWNGVVE